MPVPVVAGLVGPVPAAVPVAAAPVPVAPVAGAPVAGAPTTAEPGLAVFLSLPPVLITIATVTTAAAASPIAPIHRNLRELGRSMTDWLAAPDSVVGFEVM